MDKLKLKKHVHLDVLRCPHYRVNESSFVKEYKKKYPNFADCSVAVYLNDYRVKGPKDFNHSVIYQTRNISYNSAIETSDILKALGVPDEIINQIEFEE